MDKVDLENKQQAYYNRGNSKFNLKDKIGALWGLEKALDLGAETMQKNDLMNIANRKKPSP